ncbi:MAG: lantibiotic dehydratase [Acidobacteriota bacterium]
MTDRKVSRRADRPFVDSEFFALRTPLLPWRRFAEWSGSLAAPAAYAEKGRLGRDRKKLEAALAEDRQRLRRGLTQILEDPVTLEAVYLASPDLVDAIEAWKTDPDSRNGRRAEESLVRYFTRMCTRSTPFGLFAGCSVGRIGDASSLELEGTAGYRRHVRLDMEYLTALTDRLKREPALRREVTLRPNPTLYKLGHRFRYAEFRATDKGRSHHLVAVAGNPFLDEILGNGSQRPRRHRFSDLVAYLVAEAGVEESEAADFINTLIDNQALLPELEPPIVGSEPGPALAATLGQFEATADAAEALADVQSRLETLDATTLGVEPSIYRDLAKDIKTLGADVNLSRLFQVDMTKPVAHAELSDEVIEAVLLGVEILYFFSPPAGPTEVFKRFTEEFVKRYESQEVPLVEVLDEEIGIGFSKSHAPGAEPSPLLEDVVFATGSPEETTWGLRERALLQLLLDAAERGDHEVELNPTIAAALAQRPRLPMPAAFATFFSLGAESQEALEKGDFEVKVSAATGPSGANLLGRFCHADEALADAVSAHVESEEALAGDALFAEIVHLPEGRVGNILLRPQMRGHVIPLLGAASPNQDQEIAITDLMVSVQGGEVVLRSKALGKRIFPRLTAAHGYFTEANLGVYKFLCSLQWQNSLGALKWDWAPFQTAKFLPRVRFRKTIVSRAQWLIEGDELQDVIEAEGADRFSAMQRVRERRKLPSRIALADMDNELVVDFDNILSIDAFIAVVKKRPFFTLKEIFPEPSRLSCRGPEGAFASEIVLPFVRRPGVFPEPPTPLVAAPPSESPRLYPPGSEWLFAKLYTGTATADWILRDVLSPLVKELQAEGAIDRWFFIRYVDPDFHLRLRFHGEPETLMNHVFPRLSQRLEAYLASRELWKLQLDCYQPEIERYGGPECITVAEKLFQHDSAALLEMLDRIFGEPLNEARALLTIRGVDAMLRDFGFDLEAKRRLTEGLAEGFAAEFNFKNTPLRHQISKKFRSQRRELEKLLAPAESNGHELAPLFDVFDRRSVAWMPAIEELKSRAEQTVVPFDSILHSLIHMMANRLLRASSRPQEMLIYSYLFRIYDSRLAREKSRGKRG